MNKLSASELDILEKIGISVEYFLHVVEYETKALTELAYKYQY